MECLEADLAIGLEVMVGLKALDGMNDGRRRIPLKATPSLRRSWVLKPGGFAGLQLPWQSAVQCWEQRNSCGCDILPIFLNSGSAAASRAQELIGADTSTLT
jgi:hypothetical protein